LSQGDDYDTVGKAVCGPGGWPLAFDGRTGAGGRASLLSNHAYGCQETRLPLRETTGGRSPVRVSDAIRRKLCQLRP